MKKITFLAAACALSFNTFAGNGDPVSNELGEKYCAKLKNGKLMIMHEGTEVTADITLNNGTKLSKDGTVWKKDGSKMILKEGECVDIEGKVMDKSKMNDKSSHDKMHENSSDNMDDNSNKSKTDDKSSGNKMNENSNSGSNSNSNGQGSNNSGNMNKNSKTNSNSNTNKSGTSNDKTVDHSND